MAGPILKFCLSTNLYKCRFKLHYHSLILVIENMEVPSFVQPVALLLAFFFLYLLIIKSRSVSKDQEGIIKRHQVPEPNGALPIIGHLHLLSGRSPIFRTFVAMAEKYGPIFSLRLGYHRILIVSSREIAKECLTVHDKVFASRPNTAAGRYIGYNNAVFGLAPYGQYWRDIRKMATLELLSAHRLEQLKHVRDSEIYSLVKDLYSTCEQNGAKNAIQVRISQMLEHLTFNIIVRMIAGKRFSRGEDSEAWRLKRAVQDATYLSGVFVEADAFPYLRGLDIQGYVKFMKRTHKEADAVLSKWLDEHLQKRAQKGDINGSCDNDFMDVMLSSFAEDPVICGYKREIVIKATSLILILTATGSSAITLTWALSLLLNHPNVLKTAQEELDTNVGKDKWVQESDIKNLKYLQAIIKETLRLYPPAPLTGIREATDDCTVAGYHIPKGTRLLINLWKLQRDPEIWTNPNDFQPERFMTTHSEMDYRAQNFEYIPFSSGRRSCPGMTSGLLVLHLTLARLLQAFEMSTMEGLPVDMDEGLGVALPKLNPLEVMLKPRLPLELYHSI